MGHIKMMGAVQPFISGAISKTVNLPQTATVEDIADAYIAGVAAGRQGAGHLPRRLQDRAGAAHRRAEGEAEAPADRLDEVARRRSTKAARPRSARKRNRMPRERQSITHKFSIGGHEGYITAGMYEDGTVGEIFLTDVGKEGSTLRGMMNSFATAISIALQYGVPLETLVQKFSYMRFEPEGITQNPEIPFAKSMPDYIMRWLASRFLDADTQEELGILTPEVRAQEDGRGGRDVDLRRDTATPANGGDGNGGAADAAARRGRGADRHAAGPPGPHGRPRPRPGVRAVRRHDAAHGLVLHVLELRQQHRLRLSFGPPPNASRARALRRALVVARLYEAGSAPPRDSPPVGVRSMSRPSDVAVQSPLAVPTPGRLMARRPSAVRVIEVASAT